MTTTDFVLLFVLFFFFFCSTFPCSSQPTTSQADEKRWIHSFLLDSLDQFDTQSSWEESKVIFLKNGARRDRRDTTTTTKPFEILIEMGKGRKRMRIRLKRSPNHPLISLVVLEDSKWSEEDPEGSTQNPYQSELDCHWTGKVKGGGSAVLSSCLHPNGFSGVLMTKEGVWLIHPASSFPYSLNSKTNSRLRRRTHGIPHLVLSPNETAQYFSLPPDVLRVPPLELEAAAKLAALDAQQRHLTRSGYSSSSAYLSSPLVNFPSEDSFPSSELLLERRSRAPESKKWVEIAVFTDPSLYSRMVSKFPNDTVAKLKDYVTTMINTMDLLYSQKSLGVELGFRLVHLEVMKSLPSNLDSNGGKAKAYLTSFCDYAGAQNTASGLWDHALLLTGLDLHEEGLKSTAGLAWAGTMCYRYYSCSLAEGYSFGSAFIITHEIGHSLGMEHDGIGVSETCDRDKYIMSPSTGPGKINWSNCSGKNLQDFIDYGTSELRAKINGQKPSNNNLLSRPTCLSENGAGNSKRKNNSKSVSFSTEVLPLELPGKTYDAYFQCAVGLGKDFKPYFQRNKNPFNNICWILYCGNGTHAVSTHPALEGTKCDKDKHCQSGQCI